MVFLTLVLTANVNLPSDVRTALDKINLAGKVAFEFRHTNYQGPAPVVARTLYIRTDNADELVITEGPYAEANKQRAYRGMTKQGVTAFCIDSAPAFQMAYLNHEGGISTGVLPRTNTLASRGNVPAGHAFFLAAPLSEAQIQHASYSSDGQFERWSVLTNLKTSPEQSKSSLVEFMYDTQSGTIVETALHEGEERSSIRYTIDYTSSGSVRSIRKMNGAAVHARWDIDCLNVVEVPEILDWNLVGLVPGCQVVSSVPGHARFGRWTGHEVVTLDRYQALVSAGEVETSQEYYKAILAAKAYGVLHVTYDEAIEDFDRAFWSKGLNSWEEIVERLNEEFQPSEGFRNASSKTLAQAVKRLEEIAPLFNRQRPEGALLLLMSLSQHPIKKATGTQSPEEAEILDKSRELFLRFWEELTKGLSTDTRIAAWDEKFSYRDRKTSNLETPSNEAAAKAK